MLYLVAKLLLGNRDESQDKPVLGSVQDPWAGAGAVHPPPRAIALCHPQGTQPQSLT